MHRFFIPIELIKSNNLSFPPEIAHQISVVLRMHAGQAVVVLDNHGNEYKVELVHVARDDVRGLILHKHAAAGETSARISLYLCLTQREKFEWMLQKCTEVGADIFVPVISSRSLVQKEKHAERKFDRWQKIIREAAEQSHRGKVPQLCPAMRFEEALKHAHQEEPALLLIPWEKERSLHLRDAIDLYRTQHEEQSLVQVAAFIGPEGGFSDEEVEAANQAGFQPVTIGPRILRMETAAVVVTALVMYELED